MLVNLGLDLDALSEAASDAEPWRLAQAHREAVHAIATCGILRLASTTEVAELHEAVKALPIALKHIWATLLVDRRHLIQCCRPEAPRRISEIESYEELTDAYGTQVRVALVSSARAELGFGVLEDEASRNLGPIEIARFEAAWSSDLLAELRARTYVPAGTTRDAVWSWIAPAAAVSRRITILDRYASAGLVDKEVHGDRRGGPSWLLERIHRTAGDAEVTLITAQGRSGRSAEKIEEAVRRLVERLGSGGIRRIVVRLAETPSDLVHDRHIRFGNILAVSIGGGLDEFSTHVSRDGYVFARVPMEDAQAREQGRPAGFVRELALRPPRP
jgi:hypothetical protein